MPQYEYKVIPAPERGKKSKGARSASDRFAHALEVVMNDLAGDGWEYHRAETLPSEERAGLTGKTTIYRNLLIFRRALDAEEVPAETAPRKAAEPQRVTEAARARSAAHRTAEAVEAPEPSAEDAAAAAAAALRSVSGGGDAQARPGLVQLMGERRNS